MQVKEPLPALLTLEQLRKAKEAVGFMPEYGTDHAKKSSGNLLAVGK